MGKPRGDLREPMALAARPEPLPNRWAAGSYPQSLQFERAQPIGNRPIWLSPTQTQQLHGRHPTEPGHLLRRGRDSLNDKGQVILDITTARVKPVTPGQGFGPKRAPTQSELNLLEQVLGGGK